MLHRRLRDLQESGRKIRTGLVGAGQMGEGLAVVLEQMSGIEASVVVDAAPGRAVRAFASAGIPGSMVAQTDDPDRALAAISDGRRVATSNISLAWCEPVDISVEATGLPEVGARVARGAIEAGKHVLQMNVETDATVGYVLRRMAEEAGVIYTLSGGDEPGAIMELYDFVTALGLEVVSAGKGKNNRLDRTATPDKVAELARERRMNPKMLASFVDGTKTMVEMTSLANGIGFVPDVRGMHGPSVTVETIATTYVPARCGGVLSSHGRVDYGRGVAPGVFVVFTTDHPKLVRDLGYLSMGPGPYYALYRPYHLANIETPISMVRAVLAKETTLATDHPANGRDRGLRQAESRRGRDDRRSGRVPCIWNDREGRRRRPRRTASGGIGAGIGGDFAGQHRRASHLSRRGIGRVLAHRVAQATAGLDDGRRDMMQERKGIGASPGIAIGPVHLHSSSLPDIVPRRVESPGEEVESLARAETVVRERLEGLQRTHGEGSEEAEVIGAHLLLLEDPEFTGEIRSLIEGESLCAEAATVRVTEESAGMLEALEDEYLAARAADVRDVGTQLLRAVLGLPLDTWDDLSAPSVLVASDFFPSETATIPPGMALGLCTEEGSPTSHIAVFARGMGLPAVVGVDLPPLEPGTLLAFDGETGDGVHRPLPRGGGPAPGPAGRATPEPGRSGRAGS